MRNKLNIDLAFSAWLAHDSYDHKPDENNISVTTLLKSTKAIILGSRVHGESDEDVSRRIPSAFGTAIHDSLESIWTQGHYKSSMKALGYPQKVIDSVKVNPTEWTEDDTPVHLEVRSEMVFHGMNVSGKFDLCLDGELGDYKTTGTYSYTSGCNDWKYRMQGSIYRILNPKLVIEDYMNIHFVFTDWSALQSVIQAKKGYPALRTISKPYTMFSIEETMKYVSDKVLAIKNLKGFPEEELPVCTDIELGRDKPIFKYYRNPESRKRSSGNFDSYHDASLKMAENGGVGIIIEKKGSIFECKYCKARNICKQKDQYIADGTLKLLD